MSDVVSFDEAKKRATELGLVRVDHVRGLGAYIKETWLTRHFTFQFAVSKIIANSSQNRLGLFWEFLNPLLTAAMYYVAFGSVPEPIHSIEVNSPIALLLDLTRGLFIRDDLPTRTQIYGLVGCTVVLAFVGVLLFWRGERRGRV